MSTNNERNAPVHDAPRGASSSAPASTGGVPIGDTFERVRSYWQAPPIAWEVTRIGDVVRLESSAGWILTDAEALLDPTRWRRVRAL